MVVAGHRRVELAQVGDVLVDAVVLARQLRDDAGVDVVAQRVREDGGVEVGVELAHARQVGVGPVVGAAVGQEDERARVGARQHVAAARAEHLEGALEGGGVVGRRAGHQVVDPVLHPLAVVVGDAHHRVRVLERAAVEGHDAREVGLGERVEHGARRLPRQPHPRHEAGRARRVDAAVRELGDDLAPGEAVQVVHVEAAARLDGHHGVDAAGVARARVYVDLDLVRAAQQALGRRRREGDVLDRVGAAARRAEAVDVEIAVVGLRGSIVDLGAVRRRDVDVQIDVGRPAE